MSDTPPAIADLLRRVLAKQQLDDADSDMLAALLRATMDDRPPKGAVVAAARRRRDAMLQEIRQKHFADASDSGAAKAMARELKRFADTAAGKGRGPAPRAGTLRRRLHEVARLGGPNGWRSLLESLQRSPGFLQTDPCHNARGGSADEGR